MDDFATRINEELTQQGRSKRWLAIKLGLTYRTLYNKLELNRFSNSEIYFISDLLNFHNLEG